MIRSIVAVSAGYLTTLIGVTTFFAIVMVVGFGGMPDDPSRFQPPAWLYALEIACSPVIAALGGYVCALIARRRETAHAVALALVMLLLGAVSAFVDAGMRPLWATAAVVLLGGAGVFAGARLRTAHGRAR